METYQYRQFILKRCFRFHVENFLRYCIKQQCLYIAND